MVMNFEKPQTAGVHHEIAPPPVLQKPRMSMEERLAARLQAESPVEREAPQEVPKSAEQERLEYQQAYAAAIAAKRARDLAQAREIADRLRGGPAMPKFSDFAPARETPSDGPSEEQTEQITRIPQFENRYKSAA